MAEVRIRLLEGETPDEVEETLFKALKSQRTGELHKDDFSDPAMAALLNEMLKLHSAEYSLLLEEVISELEKDQARHGNK